MRHARRAVRIFLFLPILLILQGLPAAATAQETLPVVDTHIHYNRESWAVYAPQDVLGLLAQAGIRKALVSSTPDDGTVMLYEWAPQVVVPILRPYRTNNDFLTWTTDQSIVGYIEERLQSGVPYRGIGEFQLEPGKAYHPVPTQVANLAADRGLWLQVHSGAIAARELATLRPDALVLWAHAGVVESPEVVSRTLDEQPNVWVEVSLRHSEIAPGGRLDRRWAALFERHADRVMIGSDTWITAQWTALPRIQADVQTWLSQLPPEIATKIAYENANRLFGLNPP